MISASLDAWLRPSRTSQPKTRIMIRYSRRTDTNRDLAATHTTGQTAAHGACIEFWSGTGRGARARPRPFNGLLRDPGMPVHVVQAPARAPRLVGGITGTLRGEYRNFKDRQLPPASLS